MDKKEVVQKLIYMLKEMDDTRRRLNENTDHTDIEIALLKQQILKMYQQIQQYEAATLGSSAAYTTPLQEKQTPAPTAERHASEAQTDTDTLEKRREKLQKLAEESEKAEKEAAAKAEREAQERMKREEEEKAKREAEEIARHEAREKAYRDAVIKAEVEAAEKAQMEARERAAREAALKAEQEAAEITQRQAREKTEQDAREKAAAEAKELEERNATEKARKEAAELAEREAAARLQQIADERARQQEAERRAEMETQKSAETQSVHEYPADKVVEDIYTKAREPQMKKEKERSLNDSLHNQSSNLNEKFAQLKVTKNLADKLKLSPIEDIKKAITLNQRIALQNKLFEGDDKAFNQTLEHINKATDYNEAKMYLQTEVVSRYNWDENDVLVQEFMELVYRKCL